MNVKHLAILLLIFIFQSRCYANRPGVRGSARSAVADPKFQLQCTVADQTFGICQYWPTLNFWLADPI